MSYLNFRTLPLLFALSLILAITSLLSFESQAMMRALNTAATGMASQETLVNTISNNIANANTTGFKRERAQFEDLMYETQVEAGARSSSNTVYNVGMQIGSGSKVSAVRKEFAVGSQLMTNRPWDLMITGQGFFGIVMNDGTVKYTRDGSFSVNYQGEIVNRRGQKLFPGFQIPPNTLSTAISPDGKIEAYVKNQREPIVVGNIPTFMFVNPTGLKSLGGNLFQDTRSSGAAIQTLPGQENAGSIAQGVLEASNVSVMTEMTGLIKAQRAYEMNSKVMGIADQMLQTVNNIR